MWPFKHVLAKVFSKAYLDLFSKSLLIINRFLLCVSVSFLSVLRNQSTNWEWLLEALLFQMDHFSRKGQRREVMKLSVPKQSKISLGERVDSLLTYLKT